MPNSTYITASIIAGFALVPAFALAQQQVPQNTLEQQINQAKQQLDRTCLEYFGRSCDEFEPMPMPEGDGPQPDSGSTEPGPATPENLRPEQGSTEPRPGNLRPDQDDVGKEINSISPESGSVGQKVSLSVDSDVIGNDWDLYFGKKAQKPLSKENISVAYPPANGNGVVITFTVPEVYVAANECKGTDRLSCIPVQTINKAVTSGTHPVWIENDGQKTNTVEFTVTDDNHPQKPTGRIKSIEPKRGEAGASVQLEVVPDDYFSDLFAESESWSIQFGSVTIDSSEVDVKEEMYHPINAPKPILLEFTVPQQLPAGSYSVHLETENGKTNTVEFTVTGNETEPSPENLRPNQDVTESETRPDNINYISPNPSPTMPTDNEREDDATGVSSGTGTVRQENGTTQDDASPEQSGIGPGQQSTEPQPAVSTILGQLQQTAQTLSNQILGQ